MSFLAAVIAEPVGSASGAVVLTSASAIILVALLRHDTRSWAILATAGSTAILAASVVLGHGWIKATEMAALNVGEALLAASVLRRFVGDKLCIDSFRQVFTLVAVALAIPAIAVSAIIVLDRALEGSFHAIQWILTSYASRVLGLLVVLPALISWTAVGVWQHGLGRLLATCTGLVVGMLVMGSAALAAPSYLQVPALLLPVVVLITVLYGLLWGSLALAALGLAVSGMVGAGMGWRAPSDSLIGFQIYLAVAALTSLVGGVAHSKRKVLAHSLREAEDRAAEARRAKANFLSAMGHEFRTPITAVLGMADLMSEADLPSSEKGYLETIKTSACHLLAMFNDLLDYSRSETGRLCISSVDFSIRDVLDQVRSFSMPQVSDLGLDFYLEVDDDLPQVVRGDPKRLRQILLNLVGNALKFTNRGSVTVRVRHKPAEDAAVELRIEVIDTGIGMSPEKLANLFQSFDLHGTSTKRSHGGIGLGLAISKRLVEAMGGQIGVASTRGVGSLFWFQVKLAMGSVPSAVPLDATTMCPLRVLVVDDGAVNRKLVSQMLGRHGHQVTAARNGVEAVEMMVRGKFEMVLMDVQMPVMDGIEATRLIRDLPDPRNRVPVLGLTASILPEEYQRCRDAGMNDVLVKPVEWEQLFGAMAEHHAARSSQATIQV